MDSERMWRTTAIVLCAAVPASFYVLGDLADAFPGVLTVQSEETGPAAGPPAQAEDWERVAGEIPSGAVAPEPDLEAGADLAERMGAHADLPVVDGNLAFSVVDAGTGTVLAEHDAETAQVPASTLKLLTAAAALRLYTGEEVLVTRATVAEGTVTLQGGGDMTLEEDDLRRLAADAVDLAREQDPDVEQVELVLDTGFLPGGENPAWGGNGRAGGWVTPTAALAVDGGWLDGEQYGPKAADPAGDAAELFAELLEDEGLEVTGEITEGEAPEGAESTQVESAPLGEIIRETLLISDNTTAELLAHLVAIARDEPATPADAAAAVEQEIRELGAELGVAEGELDELVIVDGSGLSRDNRVPSSLLSAVLADVASGNHPRLEQILYDVPIAGLSGTLGQRFEDDDTRGARGVVRGKTGYLGGAATLAGIAVLPDGRTVGYSIVVHGFDGEDADDARAAVDEVAAEMVRAS